MVVKGHLLQKPKSPSASELSGQDLISKSVKSSHFQHPCKFGEDRTCNVLNTGPAQKNLKTGPDADEYSICFPRLRLGELKNKAKRKKQKQNNNPFF